MLTMTILRMVHSNCFESFRLQGCRQLRTTRTKFYTYRVHSIGSATLQLTLLLCLISMTQLSVDIVSLVILHRMRFGAAGHHANMPPSFTSFPRSCSVTSLQIEVVADWLIIWSSWRHSNQRWGQLDKPSLPTFPFRLCSFRRRCSARR